MDYDYPTALALLARSTLPAVAPFSASTLISRFFLVLSPAYDLLPVNANMPADKEEFALAMNGKKMNIRKGDFLKYADTCGISRQTAEKLIENLVRLTPKWLKMCDKSLLPDDLKERLTKIITERTGCLISK